MKLKLELSLVHRMFIPVLLANILIWWLWIVDAIGQEVILDLPTTYQRVSVPGQALQAYRTESEALMFTRAIATVFDWPYDNPNLIELWSHDQRRLFHSTQRMDFAYAPLIGVPGTITPILVNSQPYNLIRYDGPRWSLRVAIPRPQREQLYWQRMRAALQYPGLQVNFWLSLALLLLGLRLALARGLNPLRQLTKRLAQRAPGDLAPLQVDARYLELTPTVAALDAWLMRLRQTQGQEQELIQQVRQRLQAPMDVIAAGVQTLQQTTEQPQRQAARRQVEQAIGQASHLIRQILDLARAERLTPQHGTLCDCAQLVRDELARMVPLAMARQIELALEAPPHLPFVVERNALLMVLHNLVENAIGHGREGGSVQVHLAQQDDDLILTVSDDGPGIAVQEQERVFERFYGTATQVPTGNNGCEPPLSPVGSGLGLAIVRQAALRLGGAVKLSAGLHGKGCQFTVILPPGTALN